MLGGLSRGILRVGGRTGWSGHVHRGNFASGVLGSNRWPLDVRRSFGLIMVVFAAHLHLVERVSLPVLRRQRGWIQGWAGLCSGSRLEGVVIPVPSSSNGHAAGARWTAHRIVLKRSDRASSLRHHRRGHPVLGILMVEHGSLSS